MLSGLAFVAISNKLTCAWIQWSTASHRVSNMLKVSSVVCKVLCICSEKTARKYFVCLATTAADHEPYEILMTLPGAYARFRACAFSESILAAKQPDGASWKATRPAIAIVWLSLARSGCLHLRASHRGS